MGELSQKRGGASAPAKPTGGQATTAGTHYLEAELYNLVQSDSSIFKFLQAGSLDGLWYWDLTAPEHEWMSPRFWEVFGFDPTEREHLAAEWQDMIFDDDLATTIDNFNKHLCRSEPSLRSGGALPPQ